MGPGLSRNAARSINKTLKGTPLRRGKSGTIQSQCGDDSDAGGPLEKERLDATTCSVHAITCRVDLQRALLEGKVDGRTDRTLVEWAEKFEEAGRKADAAVIRVHAERAEDAKYLGEGKVLHMAKAEFHKRVANLVEANVDFPTGIKYDLVARAVMDWGGQSKLRG